MHKVQIVSNAHETGGTFVAIFTRDDDFRVERYVGWTDRGHGVADPMRNRYYVEHHDVKQNAAGIYGAAGFTDLWFEEHDAAMAAYLQAVGAAVLAAEADRRAAVAADTAQIAAELSA